MRADFDADLRQGSAEFASSLDPPSAASVRARGDQRRRRRVLGSTAVLVAVAAAIGGTVLADSGGSPTHPVAAGHSGAEHAAATSSAGRPVPTPTVTAGTGSLGVTLSTPTSAGIKEPVPVMVSVLNRGAARSSVTVQFTLSFPKGVGASAVNVSTSMNRYAAGTGTWTAVPLRKQISSSGVLDEVGTYTMELPPGTTDEYLDVYAFGYPFDVSLQVLDGAQVIGHSG